MCVGNAVINWIVMCHHSVCNTVYSVHCTCSTCCTVYTTLRPNMLYNSTNLIWTNYCRLSLNLIITSIINIIKYHIIFIYLHYIFLHIHTVTLFKYIYKLLITRYSKMQQLKYGLIYK